MWNRRDYATLATAALGAFALTLAAFWAAPLQAGDSHPLTESIKIPAFTLDSTKITATLNEDAQVEGAANNVIYLHEGAIPSIQITLQNASKDKPAEAPIRVQLLSASARDRMGRLMMIRPPVFNQDYNLTLNPGETKSFDIPFDKVVTVKGDTLTLIINKQPALDVTPQILSNNPPPKPSPIVAIPPIGPGAIQLLRMAVQPLPANPAPTAKTPAPKPNQVAANNTARK